MDENKNYEDQIDAYLLGKLKGEELKNFEDLMNSNNDIKMEVRIKKDLKESFEIEEAIQLKDRLKGIQSNTIQETPIVPIKRKSKTWILYAAAIALLAGVLVGSKLAGILNPTSSQEHYASYFEPYPLDIGERGSNEETITQVKDLYQSKKYSEAITLLNGLTNGDDKIQWTLYRGVSFLETRNLKSAIIDLKEVANSTDENWNDHGRWYLALAYLKSDNVTAAKKELELLAAKSSADHKEEAKDLLSKL